MKFEPAVPEVLADIKTIIFLECFCSLILRLELSYYVI